MTAPPRTTATSALRSAHGQTQLMGEEVYLRPFAPGDADQAVSWTFTHLPVAPDRIRARIDDGERGDEGGPERRHLLIVRRADERVVGSVLVHTGWFATHDLEATVDPIYGRAGDRWKGEALAMVMRVVTDEWQAPAVAVRLMADETAAIERLEVSGARQTTRLREAYIRDGVRVDGLRFERLNRAWVERLGDPALVPLPRSGTGKPRPVTPPVPPAGDPPANAVRVGSRVYLRPIQRDDARAVAHWAARETDIAWSNGHYIFGETEFWSWVSVDQAPSPPRRLDFAVCLRDTGALIGFVGIMDLDYRHRTGETASEMIDPAYRGSGYGSEAKHLMFDYAFDTLGLHALRSRVFFTNTRSAAALRKQGYRDAGRIHWAALHHGTLTNMGAFDLLAEDWRAMPRRPHGEPA